MKITKSVLSILAIAISSSAFASTSNDGQSISDQIKCSFEVGQPSYDVVAKAASENIYEGVKGDSAKLALKSVDEVFYAGIIKSINAYEADKVLANQLAITRPSENLMPALREVNIGEMVRSLNGTLFFTQAIGNKEVLGYTTQVGNVGGESLLENASMNSEIRDGAIKVATEYKSNQNDKAISEFNTLQELALKESDPAVKNLIKQAADLKLASYTK